MREESMTQLKILFSYRPPQDFYDELVKNQDNPNFYPTIQEDLYLFYGMPAFPNFTRDEMKLWYQLYAQENASPFYWLAKTAAEFISDQPGEPRVFHDSVLEWREITQLLGQDLLVCGYLAKKDQERRVKRENFSWKSPIDIDDSIFLQLCQEGFAENHYHLYGSSKIFEISWSYAMNYPHHMEEYLQKFHRPLHTPGKSLQASLSMEKVITWASYLRCILFQELEAPQKQAHIADFLQFQEKFSQTYVAQEKADALRLLYGSPFSCPSCYGGQVQEVLDYCHKANHWDNSGNKRDFFSGERSFLYDCFSHVFQNPQKYQEFSCLFYLYLLLKQQFREELIQNNQVLGFENFALYQSRKDLPWSMGDPYLSLAFHLSVGITFENQVSSLELRISPPDTLDNWLNTQEIYQELRKQQPGTLFFTIHFQKGQEGVGEFQQGLPRNHSIRRKLQKQSAVFQDFLRVSPQAREMVRGIDAASTEIHCRPEVFAMEFRRLQEYIYGNSPVDDRLPRIITQQQQLGISFHVGEDFLDLVDGLRAIHEALGFLHLKQGHRLGHALALGIFPGEYYSKKGMKVRLPAQDMLDNISWLLYHCPTMGVEIPSLLQKQLELKAWSLLGEISSVPHLFSYQESLCLRGDDPSLYLKPTVEAVQKARTRHQEQKEYFSANPSYWGQNLDSFRQRLPVIEYVHQYHFDKHVRTWGARFESFPVTEAYLHLVEQVQEVMMRQLVEKGISIECNPSSNLLIGPMDQYQHHPLFRFHPVGDKATRQLMVTINTDDQGIFDSSLPQEFALLLSALRKETKEDGSRRYGEGEIFQYLERLRLAGFQCAFS